VSRLLHYLPYVIALVLLAASAYVAFRLGQRWKQGYADAKELRAKMENQIASDAVAKTELRQQLTQTVNASPVINIGSDVQSELHHLGRGAYPAVGPGALCPLCSRPDCWLNCGSQVGLSGPVISALSEHLGHLRRNGLDRAVRIVDGASPGPGTTGQHHYLDSEEELVTDDPEL